MTETTSHRTPGGALLTKTRVYDYRVVKPTRDFSTEFSSTFDEARGERSFYVSTCSSSRRPPSRAILSSSWLSLASYAVIAVYLVSHPRSASRQFPPGDESRRVPPRALEAFPRARLSSVRRDAFHVQNDTLRHGAGPSPREEIAVPRGGAHRSPAFPRGRGRVARSARAPGGFRHDDGRATPSAQFLQFRRGRVVHRVQRQRRALFSPRRAIQPVKRRDVIHQQKPTRRRRRRRRGRLALASLARVSPAPRSSPPPTSSSPLGPPRRFSLLFVRTRVRRRVTP